MKTQKKYKPYLLTLLVALVLSSCSIQTRVYHDDVYYDPSSQPVQTSVKSSLQSKNNSTQSQQSNPQTYAQQQNNAYYDEQDSTQYYDESDSIQPEYSTSDSYQDKDGNTYITNNNYYDDYYDYSYSSRIRRFDDDWDFPYYSSYYTNSYWYSYDPWDWGVSIYLGYPWWGFSYAYRPYYGYGWHYRPYYWGSYWSGYDWGYWDGYNDGYWDGYYDGSYYNYYTPYYYNSYDQTLSHTHRRGGVGSQSPSTPQHGTYQSFVNTYERLSASKPMDSKVPSVSKPINSKPTLTDNNTATGGTQNLQKPTRLEKPESSTILQQKPQRLSASKPSSQSLSTPIRGGVQQKPARLEKPQRINSSKPATQTISRPRMQNVVKPQQINVVNLQSPQSSRQVNSQPKIQTERRSVRYSRIRQQKPISQKNIRPNLQRQNIKSTHTRRVRPTNIRPHRRQISKPNETNTYYRPQKIRRNTYARPSRRSTIKYQRPQRTSNYKQYSRPSYRSRNTSSYSRSVRTRSSSFSSYSRSSYSGSVGSSSSHSSGRSSGGFSGGHRR